MHSPKRTLGIGTKLIIGDANWKAKGLQFARDVKIELWINGKRSRGSMSPDLSSSRMKVHQDSQLLSVGPVFDQRLFQLFRYVVQLHDRCKKLGQLTT